MKNAIKDWGKKASIVVGMFIIGVGTVYLLGGNAEARQVGWVALSPAAQTELDGFEAQVSIDRCKYVKNLATAKLLDDMNGVAVEGIDRNDLAQKRDMVCDGKAITEPVF